MRPLTGAQAQMATAFGLICGGVARIPHPFALAGGIGCLIGTGIAIAAKTLITDPTEDPQPGGDVSLGGGGGVSDIQLTGTVVQSPLPVVLSAVFLRPLDGARVEGIPTRLSDRSGVALADLFTAVSAGRGCLAVSRRFNIVSLATSDDNAKTITAPLATHFDGRFKDSLTKAGASLTSLAQEYRSSALDDPTIAAEDVLDFRIRLQEVGFTADETAVLRDLQATGRECARLAAILMSVPLNEMVFPTTFTKGLGQVAQAFEAISSEFNLNESIAEVASSRRQ
jgi:hypothetical protein